MAPEPVRVLITGKRHWVQVVLSNGEDDTDVISISPSQFSGAAGQIGYSLIPLVCKGDVFGPAQPVILHLLDIPPMKGVLDGVVMEINDCAYPLLLDTVATVDEAEAFRNIDAAFLVGSMPRREGMERKDLLAANVKVRKRIISFSFLKPLFL